MGRDSHGKSITLDFCENIKSGRVFHTDSNDIKIVGLSQLGGGGDTKRSRVDSPFSGPVLRKSVTSFLGFIALAQRLSLPGTFFSYHPGLFASVFAQ